jgi:hypothetical protein
MKGVDGGFGSQKGLEMANCVGCGYCCLKTPCDAARRLYPGATACPQLRWEEQANRYVCGLMTIAGTVGESYRQELYAGAGCCSALNSWRKDVKNRHHNISDPYQNPLPQIFQIFLKCWAQEFISSDSIALVLANYIRQLEKADYAEKEINIIKSHIAHCLKENRHSHIKEFMG